MLNKISESSAQTELLGKDFSALLDKQDVVLLQGQLGGGKTTFVKGLAKGFGYRGRVLSPSFTLARKYPAKKARIHHLDLYRLAQEEFKSIDIDGYLYDRQGVCLIEWGEKIEDYLDRYLKIVFLFFGPNKRKLMVSQKGYGRDKIKNW